MSDGVDVVRDDERSRYAVLVDGEVAGYTVLAPAEGATVVLPHTVVDPAYAGRGLGTTLVAEALADLARRGEAVVPVCPFVAAYLKDNDVAGLRVDWPEEHDAADAAAPSEPA